MINTKHGGPLKHRPTWAFPLKPAGARGLQAFVLEEAADVVLGVATFHLRAGDYIVFGKSGHRQPSPMSASTFDRHFRRSDLNG